MDPHAVQSLQAHVLQSEIHLGSLEELLHRHAPTIPVVQGPPVDAPPLLHAVLRVRRPAVPPPVAEDDRQHAGVPRPRIEGGRVELAVPEEDVHAAPSARLLAHLDGERRGHGHRRPPPRRGHGVRLLIRHDEEAVPEGPPIPPCVPVAPRRRVVLVRPDEGRVDRPCPSEDAGRDEAFDEAAEDVLDARLQARKEAREDVVTRGLPPEAAGPAAQEARGQASDPRQEPLPEGPSQEADLELGPRPVRHRTTAADVVPEDVVDEPQVHAAQGEDVPPTP